MLLSNPKLGKRYKIYLNNENRISKVKTESIIEATLIALDPKDQNYPLGFGWMANETHPLYAVSDRNRGDWKFDKPELITIANIDEFFYIG